MAKTTLKIYPNERKRSQTTGKIPLYLRITRNNKKVESRLDWEISDKELDNWNNKLCRVEFETMTNDFVNSIMGKFSQLKFSEINNMNDLSIQEIRNHVMGINQNSNIQKTILQFAEDYYTKNVGNSSRFKEGTKKNYRKSLNHLRRFVKKHGYESTRIGSLNYRIASDMKSYLLNDNPESGQIGMSEVSAYTIVKNYKTIFNEAVEEELIKSNPFCKIKLSTKSPEKPKLNTKELKKMSETMFSLSEQLHVDLFLFMCFTGCAYTDCQDLTYENIEKDDYGFKLSYHRNKTGEESCQYLSNAALSILDDLGLDRDLNKQGYLLPRVSNVHFNRVLKIIGLKAGIKFNLTTHIARHTYRQLLDEADIVDPSVIQKQMGWSSRGSMDSIYRRVTDTRLFKTKKMLDSKLKTIM